MGRPTNERKEKTVKLRISEELYEEVVKRGDNVSETIRKMIRESVPQKKEAKNNVPQNKTSEFHRLSQNGAAYGLSGGELAEKLMDAMDTGAIIYEDGEFRAESEYNFEKFERACKDKGVPVQKMIDKCTQMIWGM